MLDILPTKLEYFEQLEIAELHGVDDCNEKHKFLFMVELSQWLIFNKFVEFSFSIELNILFLIFSLTSLGGWDFFR